MRTGILKGAYDGGGKACTDGAGFGKRPAVGQPGGDTGEESIAGPGGIGDGNLLRRTETAVSLPVSPDSAVRAESDYHGGYVTILHAFRENACQMLRILAFKIHGEKNAGFLPVADETICLLQVFPPFQSDIDIGYSCVDPRAVFVFKTIYFLHQGLLQVQLDQDAVSPAENAVAFFLQGSEQWQKIRPVGDRRADIVIIIKDGKPGSQTVRYLADKACIDTVLLKAGEYILSGTGEIREGDKLRGQSQITEIFGYIPAYSAVDITDFSGIPPAWNIGGMGISLYIHENGSDDCDAHLWTLLSLFLHINTAAG